MYPKGWLILYECHSFREPFGGSTCPYSFTNIVSEPATDLSNDSLASPDWDGLELHPYHVASLDPPISLGDYTPFGTALPSDVEVSFRPYGIMDDFIDDIITASRMDENWPRLVGAALLSLYVLGRPILPDEPLIRDDIAVLNKLTVEGRINEVQKILGWTVDSRHFVISLPEDEHSAWLYSLEQIIHNK